MVSAFFVIDLHISQKRYIFVYKNHTYINLLP